MSSLRPDDVYVHGDVVFFSQEETMEGRKKVQLLYRLRLALAATGTEELVMMTFQ